MKTLLYTLAVMSIYLRSTMVAAGSLQARNDIMCAVIGDERSASYRSYSDGTYPACSDSCFADSRCQSFAIGAGRCLLYDISVDQNFDWDPESSYQFYDIGCEKVNKQCDVSGYDTRTHTYDYSSGTTNSECIKRCLSQKNCRSYAFGNGECLLYEVPVSGNFNARSSSPYKFYDRSCIVSTTTTAKTTGKPSSSVDSMSRLSSTTTLKPSTKTTTTTTTKVATTTVTISNQPFYCTAIKK